MSDSFELRKDTVLRPRRGLESEDGDRELLVHDRARRRVVALNPSAALIWQLCDGTRPLAQVEAHLRREFPDAAEYLADDLRGAVRRLLHSEVLEVSRAD